MAVSGPLDILFEDNHLYAINKPAGLASQRDETDREAAVDLVREEIRVRYDKPGNVYLGLVHRLDQVTSGALMLAKTSKAAGRLTEQFRLGTVEKHYLAIVEGDREVDEGLWIDWLHKDPAINAVRVVDGPCDGAKEARTLVVVRERWGDYQTLELRPETGRGHQLRTQLAARGLPILGDTKYGSTVRLHAEDGGRRIALHAARLSIVHPTRREDLVIEAPMRPDWPVLDRAIPPRPPDRPNRRSGRPRSR